MEYKNYQIIAKVIEFFDIVENENDFAVNDEISDQTIVLMIVDENFLIVDETEYETIDDAKSAIDLLNEQI